MRCWRKRGCIFNSNFPSYKMCTRENYSVNQCEKDNKEKWEKAVEKAVNKHRLPRILNG